ncbi:O-antigen ligase family protein [Candidatus Njordibacter sp. Uisw_056]|uniref:O-antigen ligase family protein n=1 Tax=Candidatus Njordibacter sp. Uisw_056 TaxID=3230973 RepID=UPI003D467C73
MNDLHHPQNALDLHQWRSKIDSVLGTLVTALILYVPFSIGALNPTAEVAAALAALISIILILSNIHKYTQAIPKPIKITMALFVIYFAIGAASYFIFPPAKNSLSNIGTSLHFALFTAIIMVMLKHPPKLTWVWLCIIGGAILSGLHTIYYGSRGAVNPILFGGISVFLAFASLISWSHFKSHKILRILPILAFILGLLASFNSLARGSWLAIPPLAMALMYYIYIHLDNKKRLIIPLTALSIVLAGTSFVGWGKIEPRVNLAVKEFQKYFAGESYQTSVGYRLETYKGALLVLKENPMYGVGVGHRAEAFANLKTRGLLRDLSMILNAHNQIFEDGIHKGLIGIASYLALMFYLLRHFYKQLHNSPIDAVGLMLIVGFGTFGLTNITFTHGTFNTFFIAMVAIALLSNTTTSGLTLDNRLAESPDHNA